MFSSSREELMELMLLHGQLTHSNLLLHLDRHPQSLVWQINYWCFFSPTVAVATSLSRHRVCVERESE